MSSGCERLGIDSHVLDQLMPLHLRVCDNGKVFHAGPTLRKLAAPETLHQTPFADAFEMIRPLTIDDVMSRREMAHMPLKLRLKSRPKTPFRAIAVPMGNGVILNLSFGISLVDAVREYGLTNEDFAVTDLATELLYLVEAKSAVFDQSVRLNSRLTEARNTAQEQANSDALTGLRNRRAVMAILAEMTDQGRNFALMRVDLDFFKDVNDTLGHAAGDYVLTEVGRILLAEVRGSDVVARIGGDEFVLVLHRTTDPDELTRLAERLISRLEQPMKFEGAECKISASIGTTTSSLYAKPSGDQMLKDSDAALYLSKRRGRRQATLLTAEDLQDEELATVLKPMDQTPERSIK